MPKLNKSNISHNRKEKLYVLIKKLNIGLIDEERIINNGDKNIKIINEALTHTSANPLINHEKLEFLGDAVLRLAATEFIEKKFPTMEVGERSALRSQLVSDQWLTKVGKEIAIEEIFLVGLKASKDKSALATLQAEATEALIGAIYECLQRLTPIHKWLTNYWVEESAVVLADPHKNNFKSALQEWTQGKSLMLPKYELQELTKEHGDPKRFFCKVYIDSEQVGKGWGRSRKEAEKKAAKSALDMLHNPKKGIKI